MLPTSLSLTPFCELIEMSPKRLEVRRTRERAAMDVAEALGADVDGGTLPIAPVPSGAHSRFDFADALAMRLTLELELAGQSFTVAAKFLRTAGLSGFWGHDDTTGDYFAGFWIGADGIPSMVWHGPRPGTQRACKPSCPPRRERVSHI